MGVELYVKAAPGLRVPREDAPRRYITDDQPVSVPATAYYLRRLHSGELVSAHQMVAHLAVVTPDAEEA